MSQFKCCDQEISNENQFDSHFFHHFFGLNSSDFHCRVFEENGLLCNTKIGNRYNLKRHFLRKHFDLVKNVFNQKTIESFLNSKKKSTCEANQDNRLINQVNYEEDQDDYEMNQDKSILEDNLNNQISIVEEQIFEPFQFNLSKEVANMIATAKDDLNLNETALIKLIKTYNDILLKSTNSPVIEKSTINSVNQFVKNRHQLRKTVLRANDSLTNFVCFEVIDSSDDSRHKYYYCPITEPIRKLLNNTELVNQLLKEQNRSIDNNYLRTYKDGTLYNIEQHDPNVLEIQLQIFYDGITVVERVVHEQSVVAGSFNNLPLKYLAKTNDMFLILITSTKNLDTIGLDKFFEPLFEENNFNNHGYEALGFKLKIKLTTVIGDMKALHELMSLNGGFRSNNCRVCDVFYSRLNNIDLPFLTNFRNRNFDLSDSPFGQFSKIKIKS